MHKNGVSDCSAWTLKVSNNTTLQTSTGGGNCLTEEERNFLEVSLGEGQDDDADAAYEEFLKTTGA